MTDGEKERIKLRATWLNGVSVAIFAVGSLAPTTQLVLNSQTALQTAGRLFGLTACCLILSVALHSLALVTARRLDQ